MINILRKIRKNTVVVIDIGAYETKVVEGYYDKKGININKKFKIKTPLGSYRNGKIEDYESLKSSLEQGLKENNIKTKKVYGVVSSVDIIVREIDVPKVDTKRLESILEYMIKDNIPVGSENYIVQYISLGDIEVRGVELSRVNMVGVPKEIVEGHLELYKGLGLEPEVLDYQGNVVSKLIGYGGIGEENSVMCVDLGHESTKITVVKGGVMQVTKEIDMGGKNIDENIIRVIGCEYSELDYMKSSEGKEDIDASRVDNVIAKTVETILEEVNKVVRYYNSRELGNDVDQIIFAGGVTHIRGVREMYNKYFDTPTSDIEDIRGVNIECGVSSYLNNIGCFVRLKGVKR